MRRRSEEGEFVNEKVKKGRTTFQIGRKGKEARTQLTYLWDGEESRFWKTVGDRFRVNS